MTRKLAGAFVDEGWAVVGQTHAETNRVEKEELCDHLHPGERELQ